MESRQVLQVMVFSDGDAPAALSSITSAWKRTWTRNYEAQADLMIGGPANLKVAINRRGLPKGFIRIERIRNPGIFFVEISKGIELGGIESITHSPGGSNIEKGYPFLWAARSQERMLWSQRHT